MHPLLDCEKYQGGGSTGRQRSMHREGVWQPTPGSLSWRPRGGRTAAAGEGRRRQSSGRRWWQCAPGGGWRLPGGRAAASTLREDARADARAARSGRRRLPQAAVLFLFNVLGGRCSSSLQLASAGGQAIAEKDADTQPGGYYTPEGVSWQSLCGVS